MSEKKEAEVEKENIGIVEPFNFEKLTTLGQEYLDQGEYEKSVDAFSKALDIIYENPESYSAEKKSGCLLGRGGSLHSLKRYDEAVKDFNAAFTLGVDDLTHTLHFLRFGSMKGLGNLEKAHDDISLAIELAEKKGSGINRYDLCEYYFCRGCLVAENSIFNPNPCVTDFQKVLAPFISNLKKSEEKEEEDEGEEDEDVILEETAEPDELKDGSFETYADKIYFFGTRFYRSARNYSKKSKRSDENYSKKFNLSETDLHEITINLFSILHEANYKRTTNVKRYCDVLEYRGHCYICIGKYKLAFEDFRSVVNIWNENESEFEKIPVYSLYNLIRASYEEQKWDEVLKYGEIYLSERSNVRGENEGSKKAMIVLERLFKASRKKNDSLRKYYYQYKLEMGKRKTDQRLPNIPKLYKSKIEKNKTTLLEGGYERVDGNRTGDRAFVFAHIAGYVMKNRKEMIQTILFSLLSTKKSTRNERRMRKMLQQEFGNDQSTMNERMDLVFKNEEYRDELEKDSVRVRFYSDLDPQEVENLDHHDFLFVKKYFLEEPFVDLENIQIRIPKECSGEEDKKKIGQTVQKILYGISYSIEEELIPFIIPIHEVFSKLGLINRLHKLCISVESLPLLKRVLLFNRCLGYFEKKIGLQDDANNEDDEEEDIKLDEKSEYYDEDRIENMINTITKSGKVEEKLDDDYSVNFNSPLSLSLFILFKQEAEIEKDRTLMKILDRMGYFVKLTLGSIGKLEDHKSFGGKKIDQKKDLNLRIFKNLYKTKKHANLKLQQTQTTQKKEKKYVFEVHKEVLIFRSNFFFRMFRFPGIESQSRAIEIYDGLCERNLRFILKYIYRYDDKSLEKSLDGRSYKQLFELLVHAEMYDEHFIKYLVLKTLLLKLEKEKENFVFRLLEIGKYFEDLPKACYQDVVVDRLSTMDVFVKGKKGINDIIEHSIEMNRIMKRNEELEKSQSLLNVEGEKKKKGDEDEEEKHENEKEKENKEEGEQSGETD